MTEDRGEPGVKMRGCMIRRGRERGQWGDLLKSPFKEAIPVLNLSAQSILH